ncbi:MAG: ABC transporter substrate-binding protein [candidate division WOR-3 bacterium]|nr:ABC transporter substrate-binding protein [candidate division WOR-3 bacterium]
MFSLLILRCSLDDSITIVYDAKPADLDPHLRREIVTMSILSNIYESLVILDPDMKPVPGLSVYWEKVDSLTWRFYLRENVKFHNKRKLSSKDVIYSMYRPFRLTNSQYASLKGYIDTILPEDTNKILIHLKIPHPFLLYDIASIFIIPENFNPSDESFCGTGPYRVKNVTEDKIELVKFTEYWDGRVDFERVIYLFIPEVENRIKLLSNGNADIITFIPLSYLESLISTGRVVATPGVAARYIEMDLSKYPFNRLEFRQALNLGINRKFLAEEIYQNFATPANQFICQGLLGFDYNLPQFSYDPDSARKLLKRLGELPTIEFDFAESRAFIARAIIEDLQKLGLRIKPYSLPVEKYWEKINSGKSYFYLIGSVPLSNEGISILRSSFHSRDLEKGFGTQNNIKYSNKILDTLIEKMIRTSDLRYCMKLINEAQRILLQDLPKIPVVWEKEIYGISKRVEWNPRLDELIIVKEIKLKK